jgi:thymidine kinase
MFAGKSEELLRRLRRAEIGGEEVAVFKPEIDDRYGIETVGSHDGARWDAIVVETNADGMDVLEGTATGADVVGIDEANFFPAELVRVVQKLADDGQRVILSGLDQTYRGDPFTPVETLMAVADDVEKLTAICSSCGRQATRTQRLLDGKPAPADMPTVQVGGDEDYEARCRHCHKVR